METSLDHNKLDQWERWIGYTILATTPFIISPSTFDSFLLPKFVWLACWASLWLVLISVRAPLKSLFGSAVDWPIAFLLAVTLLSILVDFHSGLQIRSYLHLLTFVVLFYAFRRYWAIGGCPYLTTGILIITSALLSLYGIAQDYGYDFFLNTGGVRDWRAKVVATLGNPNFVAEYLAICLPCILAFAIRNRTSALPFILTAFVITLMIACHTVTFCVGATMAYLLTLLLTLMAAAVLRIRPQFSWLKLGIILVCMVIAAGWYLTDNPYNSHGHSLYKEAWQSPQWWSGAGSRDFNWRTTAYMIKDEPLSGVGFGNYLTVHEHYQGINYERQGRPHDRDYVIPVDQPHFQWLETAAEAGPLGALALAWLVTAWVRAVLAKLRETNHSFNSTYGVVFQPNTPPKTGMGWGRVDDHQRESSTRMVSWFLWGCWGGIWIAVIHSFANFPFHVPASSLLFVVLAAYPLAPTSIQVLPAWKPKPAVTIIVLVLVGGFSAINYFEYLGNQYLKLGYELQGVYAIDNLNAAKVLDPFNFQTHYMLGVRQLEMGWPGRAEESFKQALTYQEDLNVHKILAQIYLQQKNLDAAIREQRRVLDLNPAYPGYYKDLANLLRQKGETTEAARLEARGQELQKILDENK